MKLTTKGRYAVTALLELAAYDVATPITLSVIAERRKLSLSYLELLFGKLRRCGLVKSVRGPGGGYVLAREADDISIAQVIGVVDREVIATKTALSTNASDYDGFLDTYLWGDLNEKMFEYLDSISLADLLSKHTRVHKRYTRPQLSPLLSVMPRCAQSI